MPDDKKFLLDIVIPTLDNIQALKSCLTSLDMALAQPLRSMVKLWIVNNGKAPLKEMIAESPNLTILEPGTNLGWEGGLNYALKHCKAKFVAFSNDDVRWVPAQYDWLWKMLVLFNDPNVAGVGPSSNYVMGAQSIFADIPGKVIKTKFLIGFFFVLRREHLDAAGGVDESLPGGDDIDLSIRLRDLGKTLLCRKDVFLFHHGSLTGNKVLGGYWNSHAMQEKTHLALIAKHGMYKFWDTIVVQGHEGCPTGVYASNDIEGDICRKHVEGEKVIELGCGGRKTVPRSIGIDRQMNGDPIPFVTDGADVCLSDLQADVSVDLPVGDADTIIARHILEHCQDTLGTLSMWNKALKVGGKLIIAVPHQGINNTILMNPEHVVSFVPTSLRNLAACAGFAEVAVYEDVNGVSFVGVYQKAKEPYFAINAPEPTILPVAAGVEEAVCA